MIGNEQQKRQQHQLDGPYVLCLSFAEHKREKHLHWRLVLGQLFELYNRRFLFALGKNPIKTCLCPELQFGENRHERCLQQQGVNLEKGEGGDHIYSGQKI